MTARRAGPSILFHCEGDDGSMLGALRARLPEATIRRRTEHATDARWDPSDVTDAIVWLPPPDFFDGLVALRRVHALSAGVDHLLAHPGLPPETTILRLEDAGMGTLMAEYVLYGVLHAHRRFPAFARAAGAGRWAHDTPVRAAGATGVGILGAGAMGQAVARRLVANGYRVGAWSRTPRALPDGVAGHVGEDALAPFLAASHVLVCLLPLTAATRGVLDAGLFAHLPRGAWLINAGRGEHLVEADLLAALDTGQLEGALLDVFADEPLPGEHPFFSDARVIVTPHVAAPSPVETTVEQVAANLEALARGEPPTGSVDRDRGY